MSQDDLHDRLHQAMYQLPGFPDHDRAEQLNGNRPGRVRGLKMNEAGRARARRWNTAVNEAGQVRAARWNTNAARHHAEPRVLVGVQEFIARLVGQGK